MCIRDSNKPLEIIDAKKEKLNHAASQTINDPLGFLRLQEVFGELFKNERFVKKYLEMIQLIYETNDIKRLMREMIS